jgi:hypothetical protein
MTEVCIQDWENSKREIFLHNRLNEMPSGQMCKCLNFFLWCHLQ